MLSISIPRFRDSQLRKLSSILGGTGLQGERMKFVAHPAAQCLIHHLMLLDPSLAAKGAGNDMRRIMIAIAAQVLDRDLSVRQAFLDQPFDHRRVHRHRLPPPFNSWPYNLAANPRSLASARPRIWRRLREVPTKPHRSHR